MERGRYFFSDDDEDSDKKAEVSSVFSGCRNRFAPKEAALAARLLPTGARKKNRISSEERERFACLCVPRRNGCVVDERVGASLRKEGEKSCYAFFGFWLFRGYFFSSFFSSPTPPTHRQPWRRPRAGRCRASWCRRSRRRSRRRGTLS